MMTSASMIYGIQSSVRQYCQILLSIFYFLFHLVLILTITLLNFNSIKKFFLFFIQLKPFVDDFTDSAKNCYKKRTQFNIELMAIKKGKEIWNVRVLQTNFKTPSFYRTNRQTNWLKQQEFVNKQIRGVFSFCC